MKKFLICFSIVLLLFTSCELFLVEIGGYFLISDEEKGRVPPTGETPTPPTGFTIGGNGPGGGTIFYADSTGAYKEVVFFAIKKTQSDAKTYAENYSNNGKDDWFLPNKNELNEVYEALIASGKISQTATYWSSTATEDSQGEPTSANAWTQSFSDGTQNNSVAVGAFHNAIAIRCYNPTSYEVGKPGPAGGTIYWVDATTNAYKEVSANLGNNNWFKASGTYDASNNTDTTSIAGNYTTTKDGETYNDWYLPNKTELNEVYVALKKDKDPALIEETSWLWSSSEHDNGTAWLQDFSYGNQGNYSKASTNGVRAIRAFNP